MHPHLEIDLRKKILALRDAEGKLASLLSWINNENTAVYFGILDEIFLSEIKDSALKTLKNLDNSIDKIRFAQGTLSYSDFMDSLPKRIAQERVRVLEKIKVLEKEEEKLNAARARN